MGAATETKPGTTPASSTKEPPKKSPIDLVTFEILSCVPHMRLAAAAAADGETTDTVNQADPDVFDVILCNSTPVERGYARLTWLMKKSAFDASYAKNGVALLLEHGIRTSDQAYAGLIDPLLQIGILENLEVDEAKEQLTGQMRFSRSDLAQQIKRDVQDQIRRYMSAGLIKLKWKLTKPATTPEELDDYTVTRWRLVEGSVVSIPAIPTALIKNSAAGAMEFPVELESDTPAPEVQNMNEQERAAAAAAGAAGGAAVAAPPTIERQNLNGGGAMSQADLDKAIDARNKQISEVVQLCSDQGVSARASEFIEKGYNAERAALEILKLKASNGTVRGVSAEVREGLALKDRKRWSLCRALEKLALRSEGKGSIDGVEGEIDAHINKRANELGLPTHGGVFIPHHLFEFGVERHGIERHAMVSNVAAKGGEFVLDSQGGFIDVLRASSVGGQLGADMMTDLIGNVPFTRQTSDVQVFFVGENPANPVTKSDMGTGLSTLSAKTMQGWAQASRQLLRLASYSYEDKLMNSFAAAHGLAFDRQGFHGKGAGGECTGIYIAPDVGAVASTGGNAPTWANLCSMIAQVAVANAHAGRVGFVTTNQLACRLKNAIKFSGIVSPPIWEGRVDAGNIDGYKAVASNQISSALGAGANEHGFIFGNFADLVYGMWGGLEITIDNITGAPSGMVNFISFQLGDVLLLHGQSFSKLTGGTLT